MTETASIFHVECPSCHTSFPVDPAKVPDGGVLARCSECPGVFRVEAPESSEWTGTSSLAGAPADTATAPEPAAEPDHEPFSLDTLDQPSTEPASTEAPSPAFGRRDPKEKARRLARVLVSDMITYNPDRHARALAGGTLEEDFEEEIKKSWSEYVDQVGKELAEGTPYFTDALNDILAQGKPVF